VKWFLIARQSDDNLNAIKTVLDALV
jgi:hypothetical protein